MSEQPDDINLMNHYKCVSYGQRQFLTISLGGVFVIIRLNGGNQ